ncbi:MAG: threonine--tRNA ligase [Patescibacteria group bacterium]|jgi:threonyl-tRNA synthetase
MENQDHLHNMRHSGAHLLAAAVQALWPDVKLGVGPVIEHGFYYDFDLDHRITEEDFPAIEAKMRELQVEGLGYEREELPIADAKQRVDELGQPYKRELIETIETTGSTAVMDAEVAESGVGERPTTVSFYTTGAFIDLCRGGHVESTREIGPFKLLSVAGAYWRGSEQNPMMQRIYAACFATQEELDAYLKQLEEAKARDHRKLGRELDLFTFSELVGPGLPLFTPKGTLVRNLLDAFVWSLRNERGYERVEIPHITKKELYERSGHWEKFKDDLFKVSTRDGHEFAMKPMNCPHHTQIYARKQMSYRELPQRYANTTMVYRDEQTGELAGLTRVRAITQDDAHVFCRYDQVKDEVASIWDIVETFYKAFDFSLWVRLSFHDPKAPEKYLGGAEVWQKAEAELRAIAKARGIETVEAPGEAAFYGPKLDFMAKDSIGREWQVATIQLDMNMPERFDLTCTNEDGQPERIVMIHAAIMGSIERFMGVLIEHLAGKFPLWLAPVQLKVLPIADRHLEYADAVARELRQAGYRVEVDVRAESVGKKIRTAQLEQVPYMLVVGDKEIEAKAVAVRSRDAGNEGVKSLDELTALLRTEANPIS